MFEKKKKALALGGGGARGLASIGALKVIERHFGRDKFPFDMIVGTSIGSFIGAAYCYGKTPEEIEEKAIEFEWPSLVDLGLHPTGLIKGNKFEELIEETIGKRSFGDLKIPFALTTTDLETGEESFHDSGDLIKLIHASCSWPGIFSAVEIEGKLLVDGGIRNSIPTRAAYESGASFVLAVNPGFCVKNQRVSNILIAFAQSVQIMGEELNRYQSEAADVVIEPDLVNIDQFDFDKAPFIIKQGELAAEAEIDKIKRKMRKRW